MLGLIARAFMLIPGFPCCDKIPDEFNVRKKRFIPLTPPGPIPSQWGSHRLEVKQRPRVGRKWGEMNAGALLTLSALVQVR